MDSRKPLNTNSLFDSQAELYDLARPDYPEKMIQDIVRVCGIKSGTRILEIGSGTGKLTFPLLATGASITAVEPGVKLAAFLEKKVASVENVAVVNRDFESFSQRPSGFDVVVAATSYHWLEPGTRVGKIASILNDSGRLAIIDTYHLSSVKDDFSEKSQRCYRECYPDSDEEHHYPEPSKIMESWGRWKNEISTEFELGYSESYIQEILYSSSNYDKLLRTFSDVILLEPERREKLISCLTGMIKDEFSDWISKRYLWQLSVAVKK